MNGTRCSLTVSPFPPAGAARVAVPAISVGGPVSGPVSGSARQFDTAVRALANGASLVVNRVPGAREQLSQAIALNLPFIQFFSGGSPADQPVRDKLVQDCRQWQSGRAEGFPVTRILQSARWFINR